jgi:endoglucanase
MWRKFEARGEHLVAKSMDDRVGCAIAIEAMRALKLADSPHEVYFVFTVQEEVGVRGAGVSAFGVQPEAAIALDVTIAGHSARGAETNVQLGAGAAIKALDAKHIPSPLVKNWMIATAQAQNIPYQMEVLTGGSTDGAAIEGVHAGVPTGVISIPCRYVHSPSETVNMADVAACTDLLVALLSHPTPALMPEL